MAHFSKPASMMTMVFAFLSILQFTIAFQHGSHHHARAHEDAIWARMNKLEQELHKRQSGNRIAIVGACSAGYGQDGKCNGGSIAAPRLEIRQLAANTDAYNLFLLGMERFQSRDKNDPLSYYQVAGIHGRPTVTWGGFPTPLVNQAGFCPHAMVLFGSWHRPYLALYEQAWYQAVLEVVEEFPDDQKQHWRDVAGPLRMPYWDWAMDPGPNRPTVPTLLRDKTMPVNKPTGRTTIPNPLYSYKFGDSVPSQMGGTPWGSFPETLRRPVGGPTRSNNNEMNARFDSIRTSLRDRVFALFASKSSWGSASTAAIGVRTDMSGGGVDSFEGIHDVIHNVAGGESGGFMYYLDLSAHDPLFWVHHCNIDRLLSMYQYTSPNTWVANGNVVRPMAQWNQGEPKNQYSPLKPFTKDQAGNYYTSVDVYETRTFNYYYPETSDRSYQQVVRAVNQLYAANGRSMSKRDGDYTSTGQYLGRPIKEGEYHTVLSVIANKYAIKGSYTVHCFLGKPDNSTSTPASNSTAPYPANNSTLSASISIGGLNISASIGYDGSSPDSQDDAPYDPSTDYTQASNYVGSYGILGGMMAGGGNASQPVMTKGSLPLTTCLQGKLASGELESLTPEHIEPYLQKNLYYKVVTDQGEVDADSIPDLHINVACTKAKPAASADELPDLSAPYKVLPKATAHLPAGKPFTYVPSALDIPLPEGPGYDQPNSDGTTPNPSHGVFPKPPNMPYEESGYCYSQQTIEYVDEGGNFLYRQMVSGGK